MPLSPDDILLWQWRGVHLNATVVSTWVVMLLMTVGSCWVTRCLSSSSTPRRGQLLLEILVMSMVGQLAAVGLADPRRYLSFLGTLFLFIGVTALLTVVPGFMPPTGSLSTTTALALCVFIAVPYYAITELGVSEYLRSYFKPTLFMLPFNIISELSRTLALATRLFGNMMSGSMILAILLSLTPLLFPIVLSVLGLLTGLVQAYIFTILAAVYLAAATYQAGDSQIRDCDEHD